ncbi:hypothetical protein BJY16_003807 [Actinoplanes octamycinicus]|uniref:Uncharacterized protein n=1 Tax=Actinoplanes octamycinicus TaxID=135948 RepID=A0A7W7GXZ2_9ACTN|nr:hypothetical protein [Actinoplanes octamycinicus]MBB4740348.1 hypothetical protein [Actinoplanes octamycinicus]
MLAVVSGCGTGGDPAPVPPRPGVTSTAAASPATAGAPAKLVLSAEFPELIPPASGDGDAALPEFTHTGTGYTLVIQCSGGGTIEVKRTGEDRIEPYPCDGVPSVYRVHAGGQKHHVDVHVTGEAHWTIQVVQGLLSSL